MQEAEHFEFKHGQVLESATCFIVLFLMTKFNAQIFDFLFSLFWADFLNNNNNNFSNIKNCSLCSVIVRVSVVLKRTVGDSD